MLFKFLGKLSHPKSVRKLIFFLVLGVSSFSHAFSVSGEIRKADDTALESTSVTFQLEVLNPTQSCVIFREVHSNSDMSNSSGHFSMVLGEGSRAFPSAGIPLQTILSNSSSMLSCEAGGTYTPSLTDTRYVRVSFKDNTEGSPVFRTITPSLKVSPMAWSYSAEDTTKLGGLAANQYLQKPGAACPGGSVATFDGTAIQCISLSTFTFDWSQINNKPSSFTPSAHTHLIDEVNSATGKYFSYRPNNLACTTNEILKWDGSRWICGTDSTGVSSAITALTGDVSASGSGSVAATINSVGGKTAAQISTAVDNITNASSLYLSKSGGTMTGALNMGAQNLTNTGYITMNANNSLHLSNNATAPGGLVAGDKGKTWFNSTTNKIEYWDGTSTKSLSDGTQATDITSITGTGLVVRNGAANYSTAGVTAPLALVAGNLVLNNTGVTAGTYGNTSQIATFSVDAQGRISSASNVVVTPEWSSITSKPTNLAGYGITDAISKAGDVMTGSLGLGSFTNATETTLISAWGTGDKGKTWFNSTSNQIKYWDGSSAQALGVSGAGLTSLNGQTGSAQTFAVGTAGTAPAFTSASNTHTLNVPMASNAGVSAGLISKTDYDLFNNKLGPASPLTGDVSGTVSTTVVNHLQGSPLLIASPTPGQVLKFDGSNWSNSFLTIDLNSQVSGTLPLASGGTGATTAAAARTNLGLGTAATKNTGVILGDIPVIGSGGITNNSMCTSDGSGGLTCTTPIPTGDFKSDGSIPMTGSLKGIAGTATSPSFTFSGSTGTGIYTPVSQNLGFSTNGVERLRIASSSGYVGIGTTTPSASLDVKGEIRMTGATSGFVGLKAPSSGGNMTFTLPALDGSSGQVLSTNGSGILSWITPSGAGITSLNGQTSPSQNLAVNTTGTTLQFNSASSTHTLSIPLASNSGVTAGLISKADYDNFSSKLDTSSSVGGDVTGTVSSMIVSKIKGISVQPPTVSGQFLMYTGSQFNSVLMSGEGSLSASGNFSIASNVIEKDNFEWTGTLSAGASMVLVDSSGKFLDLTCGTNGQAVVWTATGFSCISVLPTNGGAMFGDIKMANNTQIRFEENNANGNSQIALRAPANLSADYQLTLPTTPGTAGQVLSTDGAGNLGWQNFSGGTPARIDIQPYAGSPLPDKFDYGWSNFGSGYANASYTLKNQQVQLRGSVTPGAPANNVCILNLPVTARPTENLVFVVPRVTSGTRGVCQVEVKTTGCLYAACASSTNSGDMISLDNIQFETY